MPERVAVFLQSASFEPAYQASTLALTAAAMGDEVWIVLGFEPLRALAQGRFGAASNGLEHEEAARAGALNLPSPAQLLAEARSLGARCVACDTLVELAGLDASSVPQLDEPLGLASIWRFARAARTVSL
ncbi:MAG: hypothetical protein RL653_752 [Pseudomonadota bacterium]|jgi:peroxiredoxin family protein